MTDVRNQISRIIDDKGFKQSTIAHRSNFTPDQLNAILKKRRKLDANEFLNVCAAMGMTPDDVANYGKERDQ